MTILKFNPEYNNFAGLAPVQGTLLSTPTFVETAGAYLATMKVPAFEVQVEDMIYPVAAADYNVGARGLQFNADLHKEGNQVSFNVTYSEDKGVIFNLASTNFIRGEKPTFGTPRQVVVDNVSVTAEELATA